MSKFRHKGQSFLNMVFWVSDRLVFVASITSAASVFLVRRVVFVYGSIILMKNITMQLVMVMYVCVLFVYLSFFSVRLVVFPF